MSIETEANLSEYYLSAAMATLPANEQHFIQTCFLNRPKLAMRHYAVVYGISEKEITPMKRRVFATLRTRLEAAGLHGMAAITEE